MNLSEGEIRGARPQEKLYRMSDGDGLFLEVSPSGARTFRVKYTYNGSRPMVKVGTHPDVTLRMARAAKHRVKAALAEGKDPKTLDLLEGLEGLERGPEPRVKPMPEPEPDTDGPLEPGDEGAWDTLAKDYATFHRSQHRNPRTVAKMIRHVERTRAAFAGKRPADIKPKDVLALVQPYLDEGKINSAHELRARAEDMFDYFYAMGYENTNPARIAKRAMPKNKRGHFPGLTDPQDVKRLMAAIKSYDGSPQVRGGLLLSAYLFPRSAMLRGMTWDEIDHTTYDKPVWEIPAQRMKGESVGRGHDTLVPLPRQALDLLVDLRPYAGPSKYVLPSPRGINNMLSDMTFNTGLRRMGFCTKTQHCHHGFRTTASTTLNEMGFNRDWIERQLGHVEDDVRGTYNKALYLEGRTAMMQAYADWLDSL